MDNNIIQAELAQEQEIRQSDNKQSIKIKINKKAAIIIAVIIVLGVLAYVNKGLLIAATVNGSPISRLAIIQKLEKASGQSLLDSLIVDKLIQNEANAKKIVVSNDEVSAELKKIEDQIIAQGGALDTALATQGMSPDDLKTQIILQKEIEKLVADKINVADQEVAKYIIDNKVAVPAGQEAATNEQIKNQIRDQKLNAATQTLISDLKAKANIQYFVKY